MKLLFLFSICVTIYSISNAQNSVGIGTATPNGSAILDVSSNNKGLLAPRMTTAQRNAIASPAKGLLVYDTDLNGLFHFNGSTWANLSQGGGGGAFTLPYSASVDLNTNALSITNAGFGAAITGITTNEFGYAVSGISNSAYGYGIYGYANAPNAVAVYGNTIEGTAVRGHSTGGIGVDARSTNNSALKASIILGANPNAVIVATHAGGGDGIEAGSNTGSGVKGTTNSTLINEAGVYGFNTSSATGNGVLGVANASQAVGVQGTSTNGTGVQGITNAGTAVKGIAGSGIGLYGNSGSGGTAIRGESANGYGLVVSGNVRLSGGNTNPQPGAVLTSTDGIGNAVWKPRSVAFKAYSPYSALLGFPDNASSRKVHFGSELYDYGGDFTPTTSSSPSAGMSTFEVPVSGLYHFDLGIKAKLDDTYDDFEVAYAYIRFIRDGTDYMLLFVTTECCNANLGYEVGLYGSTDAKLQAGDKVYVIFYQRNDDEAVGKLVTGLETYFNGHLVFAN
jgi:hypothetical protein